MTLPTIKRLMDVKKQAVYDALKRNNGNKTQSAKELGMCLNTLRHMANYDPMFSEFKKIGPGMKPRLKRDDEAGSEIELGAKMIEEKEE